MATAEQIKALLRSYSDADGDQFVSVAMQIAAHAARTGKKKFARELRELIDEVQDKQKREQIGGAVPIARPHGELVDLLLAAYPKVRFSEMVLSPTTSDHLNRVLREYRQQGRLREHNLSARRKLLLVGPPGTGKTMSSRALAGELKLPHLTVQLHGLITKFMGETAAKLHSIFEAMRKTRGVYLFDEFDAIGSERQSTGDVGEIRRVLNSYLQFLEQDDSDSIIVAATNLVEMLDDALFRRFDDVIRYEKPSDEEIKRLFSNRLAMFGAGSIEWKTVTAAATGLSHAEVCRASDDAAKDTVLDNRKSISTDSLIQAIERQKGKTA